MSIDLLSDLPEKDGFAFVSPRTSFYGRSVEKRFVAPTDNSRFSRAQEWLDQNFRSSEDFAFLSFTFDEQSTGSEVVLCSQSVRQEGSLPPAIIAPPVDRPVETQEEDVAEFLKIVTKATGLIANSPLQKVVLARKVSIPIGHLKVPSLAASFHEHYPTCMTYVHNNFLGASPELLLQRRGTQVESLVLAGTAAIEKADMLAHSDKDLIEHRFAVESAKQSLESLATTLEVPDKPSILRLPNVAHLATRLKAEVPKDIPTLEVLSALHPTAAVCGTPRELALDKIRDLEGGSRGRYAGPSGVICANGDADIALALRGLVLEDGLANIYVGCGIVGDSVPEDELLESKLKARAVLNVIASVI